MKNIIQFLKQNMKVVIPIIIILVILIIIGIVVGVSNSNKGESNQMLNNIGTNTEENKSQNPVATMEVENYGTVKIELYPDIAPNTVKNFIALSNKGFYDNLTFHRIVKDFMIQGGDKKGDGTGGASLSDIQDNVTEDKEYTIKGEFKVNRFRNDLEHKEGVISMARSDYSSFSSALAAEGYNSASSQFFIMTEDNSNLDGLYAAFGKVVEGMDVINKIEETEVEVTSTSDGKPINPPVIKSIRVDTFGVDYGLPETKEPFDINSYIQNYY